MGLQRLRLSSLFPFIQMVWSEEKTGVLCESVHLVSLP